MGALYERRRAGSGPILPGGALSATEAEERTLGIAFLCDVHNGEVASEALMYAGALEWLAILKGIPLRAGMEEASFHDIRIDRRN